MAVQAGSLGNNKGATKMGKFGDLLLESCVYANFGHLDYTLM